MTTIAYKDGVIAYDSRLCRADLIVDDAHDKRRVVKGVSFFFCGSTCDESKLIDCYFGSKSTEALECSAIVVDKGRVYSVGIDADTNLIFKSLIPHDRPDAMGSGSYFALTAMDMGADAKKAVTMAAKRDSRTGGKIRVYKVK